MDPKSLLMKLRELPHCVAIPQWPGVVADGRLEAPTLNLFNGMVVALHITATGFMKVNDHHRLVVSCPVTIAADPKAHGFIHLDVPAGQALLDVWTGQASLRASVSTR